MNASQQATSISALFDLAYRDLGFSDHELAIILGSTTRMVERWHSGVVAPSPHALDRLLELEHVRARLYYVYEAHDALAWLRTPNEHLNWLSPAAALLSGSTQKVEQAIDQIGYRLYR